MKKGSLTQRATLNGLSGGDKLQTFTIYCVSRDLIIRCNENNLGYWLKNANYTPTNIVLYKRNY